MSVRWTFKLESCEPGKDSVDTGQTRGASGTSGLKSRLLAATLRSTRRSGRTSGSPLGATAKMLPRPLRALQNQPKFGASVRSAISRSRSQTASGRRYVAPHASRSFASGVRSLGDKTLPFPLANRPGFQPPVAPGSPQSAPRAVPAGGAASFVGPVAVVPERRKPGMLYSRSLRKGVWPELCPPNGKGR